MKTKLLLTLLFAIGANSLFASGLVQQNWRWRYDNGTEATATFAGPENTPITLSNTGNIGLRIKVKRTESGNGSATTYITYSTTPTDDESFVTINSDASNAFVVAETSPYVADGAATTIEYLSPTDATNFLPGKFLLTNSLNGVEIAATDIGKSAEVEFIIKATANALPNTTYYFKTNNADSGKSSDPTQTGIPHLTTAAVLPVGFLSFGAKLENNGVSLTWSTSSEQNNEKFIVQRSIDGKNWTIIGTVKGEGNSFSRNEYSVLDQNPENGTNYYQLKQYDLDGTVTLLASKSVNYNLQPTGVTMSVYPNPSFGDINFTLNGYKDATVKTTLVNTQGQIVHKESFLPNNTNSYKLNLSTKPGVGVYILKVEGDGFSVSKNVLVN